MSDPGKVERVLDALPRMQIANFAAGEPIPRKRSVKTLLDYNGFSGLERSRTWEVVKWLMAGGCMPYPSTCDLCAGAADQYHAENYFDFASYVPICRSCHAKVHNRLRNFKMFEVRRGEWNKPENHWVTLLTDRQLPVAEWCRAHGVGEPVFADFIASA